MRKWVRDAMAAALLGGAALGPIPRRRRGLRARVLGKSGYFEAPGVNLLVFSNWYDGLFADSKISGVELIQQGVRTATNGDVRLSATPGQWDAIGRLASRNVDTRTGVIEGGARISRL